MGSAISSSAAAAAESLADAKDTNVTTAASSHVNDGASSSSPTTTAATTTTTTASSPRRRTARKSKATDFYAPCERINLEAPSAAAAQNQKKRSVKKEKENDAPPKNIVEHAAELEDKWEKYRQELIQYKKEHDTYFVSMETNKKLARWADNQRQFYRRGKMNDVRIGLLQEIGFFDVEKPKRKSPVKTKILMKNTSPVKTKSPVKNNSSTLEDMWEENRQALIAYKNEHGTFFVSQQVDKKLARWADNQRQFHRRGEMNEVRQQLLQEIGFFDELSNRSPQKKNAAVASSVVKQKKKRSLDELWEDNRQAVIADKVENNGSFSFHPKSKLGRWVENQKRAKKLGKLSEERVTLLNEILNDQLDNDRRDEALRKSADAMWEKTRQELIAHKEEHGDYSVPSKSKLGRWIENQKRAYKLYDMPAERAELMKEMGLFPQRPEDMVDGRSSPRKKRKTSHRTEEESTSEKVEA